jgi:hypothetical protein
LEYGIVRLSYVEFNQIADAARTTMMDTNKSDSKTVKHAWPKGSNTRLVAYLRPCEKLSIVQQRQELERFCTEHGYHIAKEFIDEHGPGLSLQAAMDNMDFADGMIATDLNRFVEHIDNRARDLRPLLHHFLTDRKKHLLVVEEGIDTSTVQGQAIALETINQLKDADEDFHSAWYQVGHHT